MNIPFCYVLDTLSPLNKEGGGGGGGGVVFNLIRNYNASIF